MNRKNKFGIEPDDTALTASARRSRAPGPMGSAIRETAETLQSATEEKVEMRRRNAADAKEYREAQREGLVLAMIPIQEIATDDLPRDRIELDAVAAADEMEELKSSISERGQRDPIELYRDAKDQLQLKSGWRRLTALRQLFAETGDERFARIKAHISVSDTQRLDLYVDMAEENVIREDLTFAEMAQLAITASADTLLGEDDAEAIVGKLYRSVHKVKRSYIRSFVYLLVVLGDAVGWPKAIPRNLGVDVARRLKAEPELASQLQASLRDTTSAETQNRLLNEFVAQGTAVTKAAAKQRKPKEKYEFHLEGLKVTAKHGECRIVGAHDFTKLPKDRLERAIKAFQSALEDYSVTHG